MSNLPKSMSGKQKSHIESTLMRAGMKSEYIQDIVPATFEYQDAMPTENLDSCDKNIICEKVQIDLENNSNVDAGRLFFNVKANIDKKSEIVNWISVTDGPNRQVANVQHAQHSKRAENLMKQIDSYISNNY